MEQKTTATLSIFLNPSKENTLQILTVYLMSIYAGKKS